jgi:hypothetical protein
VWSNHVLPRDASISRNGRLANSFSRGCILIRVIAQAVPTNCQPSTGVVMAVFKPAFPAVLPNPQNVLEGTIATKCSIVAAAPTFLEVYGLSFPSSGLTISDAYRLGHVI